MFDAEQNLPGFLMTNLHMLKMIHFQSKCEKFSNGWIFSKYYHTDDIFGCLIKPKPETKRLPNECNKYSHLSFLSYSVDLCRYLGLYVT